MNAVRKIPSLEWTLGPTTLNWDQFTCLLTDDMRKVMEQVNPNDHSAPTLVFG
jgi:hypothetical protein